jgi:hypothetical protein
MRLERFGAGWLPALVLALALLAPGLAAAAACCPMAGQAAAESEQSCPALGAASCCGAPAAVENGKLSWPPAPALSPAPGPDSPFPARFRAALAAPTASVAPRPATVVLRL